MSVFGEWSCCDSPYLRDSISGLEIVVDSTGKILGLISVSVGSTSPIAYYAVSGNQPLSTQPSPYGQLTIGQTSGRHLAKSWPGALSSIRFNKVRDNGIMCNLDYKYIDSSGKKSDWIQFSDVRVPQDQVISTDVWEYNLPTKCFSVSYNYTGLTNMALIPQSATTGASDPVVCDCGYTWMVLLFIVLLVVIGYGGYQYGKSKRQ